jgi:hypothetical protein
MSHRTGQRRDKCSKVRLQTLIPGAAVVPGKEIL